MVALAGVLLLGPTAGAGADVVPAPAPTPTPAAGLTPTPTPTPTAGLTAASTPAEAPAQAVEPGPAPTATPSPSTEPTELAQGPSETPTDAPTGTPTQTLSDPSEAPEPPDPTAAPAPAVVPAPTAPGPTQDEPLAPAAPASPSVPASSQSPAAPAAPAPPTAPALPGAVLASSPATGQALPVLAPPSSIAVGPRGWGNPVVGRLTSPFGYRVHPIFASVGIHTGQDVAAACGTPVHAAADGFVVYAGPARGDGRTGNQLIIAHGGGLVTRMGHVATGGTRVAAGDAVVAGQEVALVGGDPRADPLGAGSSTGCHLHFETLEDAGRTPVDPVAFLVVRGVRLGVDTPLQPASGAMSDPQDPAEVDPATVDEDRIRRVIRATGPEAAARRLG